MLVDSHCHFHLLEDTPGPEAALEAAVNAGVSYFLNVAVDVEHRDDLVAFAERHPRVFTSVGVHPSGRGEDPAPERIAALAEHPRVIAVGETGLDYVTDRGELGWQRDRFRRHVEAARLCGRPIIVHSRGAPEDTVAILRETAAGDVGGVIHCFVEDYATARALLDLGFHLSLSGILTFRNADALRETARRLPPDRLLIETDCPYLAPVPHRGQENRPAWVGRVAECLAEIQGRDAEAVAWQTAGNFFDCFSRAPRPDGL
ncbi:TatD family hydrolase [Spiribacter halobius]|uniref:TatD family deoxyribonuclease n=1 Tax=Sediminicurvatus halobius TaxID=2182432 RepID=A0A2U2N2F6_9GAMM|nr:TatD family hydrolase [Spiribacter halobius]PWG63247.1 TatD family deoxyribonuclease [Spiribacter halobius]UEX76682.1 TatD family hydrolase [Spiribacter halobius]